MTNSNNFFSLNTLSVLQLLSTICFNISLSSLLKYFPFYLIQRFPSCHLSLSCLLPTVVMENRWLLPPIKYFKNIHIFCNFSHCSLSLFYPPALQLGFIHNKDDKRLLKFLTGYNLLIHFALIFVLLKMTRRRFEAGWCIFRTAIWPAVYFFQHRYKRLHLL